MVVVVVVAVFRLNVTIISEIDVKGKGSLVNYAINNWIVFFLLCVCVQLHRRVKFKIK